MYTLYMQTELPYLSYIKYLNPFAIFLKIRSMYGWNIKLYLQLFLS